MRLFISRDKKWIKRLTAVMLSVIAVIIMASAAMAAQEQVWPEVPEVDGEAIVLMEANTSAKLFSRNEDQIMYPASTTKILTAIVVLENCSLDETVTFTAECCDLEEGAVTIDTVPGEQMSLKDVMYGLLLPSGNDCAMALAIHTAGSVDAFAEMMNEKARDIGATSSHFSNPSGLFDSRHYTTAGDLALIAQYAFRNSTLVDIISHPTYIIEPTNMYPESRVLTNSHEMIIPGGGDYNEYVIGGKTGYLYEAGRCLITYAEKDGMTLLSVVLNSSYYGIFAETQELLDYGWSNFMISNVSESERKFSYADEKAKVQIDSTSQIITLRGIPFSDLTSDIRYAYYLNEDEYQAAKEAAGITGSDRRQLYAAIDYSYAGNYLGSSNVFINPDMEIRKVNFIKVVYINALLIILIAVLVVLAVIFVIRLARKSASRQTGPGKGRSKHRKVRHYDRSDAVDLGRQYIRSSNRNRNTIHKLDDISVSGNYEFNRERERRKK
ncbi:MAG: D-alanyl-D-alanine carboxypeptidase [Parasporobacterium sp.]|nr:D-alanyl-D-alanine carboxypeptidase [Parasporobacterium sp.]